jgi:hypothetical protein
MEHDLIRFSKIRQASKAEKGTPLFHTWTIHLHLLHFSTYCRYHLSYFHYLPYNLDRLDLRSHHHCRCLDMRSAPRQAATHYFLLSLREDRRLTFFTQECSLLKCSSVGHLVAIQLYVVLVQPEVRDGTCAIVLDMEDMAGRPTSHVFCRE